MSFEAGLPLPYSENWRQAERAGSGDSPRFAVYQAPEKEPVPFVLERFAFRGGQSVETAEYPFDGLWSNERLNEKAQALNIKGYIRGAEYIKGRNALIENLRIPTSDDKPGYIDLPFWGRFPVVVIDYDVSESSNEKGQCAVSLELTRAGVSPESRSAVIQDLNETVEAAVTKAESAIIADFEKKLETNKDDNVLMTGFGKIKTVLSGVLGRVHAAQTLLNSITAEINGISGLIAQGVRAPGELAGAMFNALASIVAGLFEIKNAAESYGSGNEELSDEALYPAPVHNNEKNVLLMLFSADGYTMDVPAATAAQRNTQEAMENLYRSGCLCGVCRIMARLDMPYQKTRDYWNLLIKLEESIDKSNTVVYVAVENMRISVSRELSAKGLNVELYKSFTSPLPLLYIAQYLGCEETTLRELNQISDGLIVPGVVYV